MLKKQYATAGGAALTVIGVNAGATFVNIGFASAMLGVSGFGALSLAISLLSIPTILLSSLLERPAFLHLSRMGPETAESRVAAASLVGAALIGSSAIGLAIGAGAWLAADAIETAFSIENLADWLRRLCFLPAGLAAWSTLESCLRARQRVVAAEFGGSALQHSSRAGLYALAFVAVSRENWPSAVAAATVASAFLPAVFLTLVTRIRFKGAISVFGASDLAFGARTSLIRLLTRAETNLDIWLVGYFASAQAVALFTVAKQFAMILQIGKRAIDALLSARIGALVSDANKRSELLREMRLARATGLAVCLAGLAAFAHVAPWLLSLLGSYEEAVPVLLMLAAAAVVTTGTGSAGQLLILAGHDRKVLKLSIAASVIFLVSSLLLGNVLGALGVGAAVCLSALVRGGFTAWLAWNSLDMPLLTRQSTVLVALTASVAALSAFLHTLGESFVPWLVFVTMMAGSVATIHEAYRGLRVERRISP